MSAYQISLFGKVQIRRGGEILGNLPAKAQELLCYALLQARHPLTREALACELWSDSPAAQSKKYLRQSLWQLQVALEDQDATPHPLLISDNEWVRINPTANLEVDAVQFEQRWMLVRDQPGQALSLQQAHDLQLTLDLYQGDLLTGWYQDWCLIERTRFHSMFITLLDKLIEYALAHRQYEQGIAYGLHMLRSDYTREKTHRQLMRLYYLAGDRTAALRQFDQCAAALAKEFDVKPTEQTINLFEQIRSDQLSEQPVAQQHVVDHSTLHSDDSRGLVQRVLLELGQIQASLAELHQDIKLIKRGLE